MFDLSDQQRLELDDPEPTAVDPVTRTTYVLVRREAYDRLKSLVVLDDYDPDEGMAHIDEMMAEDDALDPYLDGYQNTGIPA